MQLKPYLQLMRFDRPIGIFLLMWPTATALLLAGAGVRTWIIFMLGVVVMRAAGCVINDIADRNFDGYVERTQSRPLALKQITVKDAFKVFIGLMFIALCLALLLHFRTLCFAVAAALLAMAYPFMKRFFHYPQLVLGVAFAWSIPMVFMEVQGMITNQALGLFASTILWVLAYDTQYAMADKTDDLVIGIKSAAISFGNYDRIAVLLLQFSALWIYLILGANWMLLLVAAMLALYQQWLLLEREPAKCLQAFLNNNYFGACVFLGFCV